MSLNARRIMWCKKGNSKGDMTLNSVEDVFSESFGFSESGILYMKRAQLYAVLQRIPLRT